MEEIVPVGGGLYQRVVDGVPVGEPFNPLTVFSGLSGTGPSGTSTTIGRDGKAIQPGAPPLDPLAPPPAPVAPEGATTTSTASDDWVSGGTASGGYQRSGGGGGSWGGGRDYASYGGGGSYGSLADPFGGGYADDPFANIPNYQNGQRHPAAGGAPLTPGGIFAQQDDGFDNRQQVYVPGGAAAGPFETRSAPTPEGGTTGNYGSSGGGESGGGNTSPLYDKLRAKGDAMAGKLQGYGGGSSDSGYSDPTKQYRRQGRRMDRAYDRYNADLAEGVDMPVVGWSKEQGFKPGTVEGFLSSPGSLVPAVFPGTRLNETTDSLTSLPMTDLALMAFGTRGRGLMSKAPTVDVPGILRQQGVKAPKPDYKRSLNPSKVANRIAEMYETLGSEGTQRLSTEGLLSNMATAKKHSALRQGLEQQFDFDPGGALDSIGSYMRSAITAGMGNTRQAGALSRVADRRLMELGPQIGRMKPKRASRAANLVAQSFLD